MPFDPSEMGSPRLDLEGDVVVINDVPDQFAPMFARRGLNTRGKQRTSIEITSEALLHDFDENMLGAGPAEAIRDLFEKQTKNVTEFASAATRSVRKYAVRALAAGEVR